MLKSEFFEQALKIYQAKSRNDFLQKKSEEELARDKKVVVQMQDLFKSIDLIAIFNHFKFASNMTEFDAHHNIYDSALGIDLITLQDTQKKLNLLSQENK